MPRNIHQIIEKQVSFWRIQQAQQEPERSQAFFPPNVVTLSNALGSKGIDIGQRVGELLQVPVYDREIVEHIATTASVRVETVKTLDETTQSRLDDYISALFRERNFDQSDYSRALTRTLMALWGHGCCVLIGRGANHVVYRKSSLSVRTVAPYAHRLRHVMVKEGLASEEEARRMLERVDAEREGFIRRTFGADIHDPTTYDLVINTAGLSVEDAAALMVEAFRKKFEG